MRRHQRKCRRCHKSAHPCKIDLRSMRNWRACPSSVSFFPQRAKFARFAKFTRISNSTKFVEFRERGIWNSGSRNSWNLSTKLSKWHLETVTSDFLLSKWHDQDLSHWSLSCHFPKNQLVVWQTTEQWKPNKPSQHSQRTTNMWVDLTWMWQLKEQFDMDVTAKNSNLTWMWQPKIPIWHGCDS